MGRELMKENIASKERNRENVMKKGEAAELKLEGNIDYTSLSLKQKLPTSSPLVLA